MSRSFREVVEDEGLELISPNSTSIQRLPALRRLGDVDNDGLSDFAFISEGFTGDNAFQIVLGSTADTGDHTFDSISDDHSFVATVTLPDSFKLSDFASAGDLNGDGLTDLQFFAVNEGVDGSPPSSRLFVVFNDAEGFSASIDASQLDGTNGFEISDGVSGRAQVADFNGDGFDDLALETSLESGGEDRVDILFGAEAGFAGTVSLQSPPEGRAISVASPPQDASIRVAKSSGDINGDGFDDLILVGANPDINTSRSVFVVFGGAGLSGANIDLSDDASDQFADIPELRTGSSFGSSVAVLEDMNGDGIADFAISAPRSSIGNRSLAGEVFVIFGGDRAFQDLASLAELDGENGFRITGADFFDNAGSALDAVGDYNGDGLSDLLVGAGRAEGLGGATEQGELYLIFGSEAPFSAVLNPDNLNGENGRRFTNADADRDLGAAVASIGDHNGDGLDDFVVGSARDAGGSNEFKIVSVLFGRETFAPDAAASSFSATEEVATELNFFANSGFGADQDDNLAGLAITAIGGAPVSPGGTVELADGGTLTLGANGIATYLNNDPVGLDGDRVFGTTSFTYTISDGLNESVGTATMRVQGVAEQVTGTDEGETLNGSDLVDRITAGGGADSIDAGAGSDFVFAGDGADTVIAGEGFDTVRGGDGDDSVLGGDGFDEIFGEAGNDTLFGGADNDELFGGEGQDHLFGGQGKDTIRAGLETLNADGGADFDFLRLSHTRDDLTITGENAAFSFASAMGTMRVENFEIFLFADENRSVPLSTIQTIARGTPSEFANLLGGDINNNTIRGFGGNDTILGRAGNDDLRGGNDKDLILGDTGADTLRGGAGRDKLTGEEGRDVLLGGTNADRLFGGDGADIVRGGGGDDLARGGERADRLFGDDGGDRLYGGEGADFISGGEGRDRIFGGNGADRLVAGSGDDRLTGGKGADRFVFAPQNGGNFITDFQNGTDKIGIKSVGRFGALNVTEVAGDTVIKFRGTTIRLDGVDSDLIDQRDFVFGRLAVEKPAAATATPEPEDDAFAFLNWGADVLL